MGLISDPEVLGCAERLWTMLGLYHGFREHLERGYQLVLSLPDACFIFKLHGPQGRVDEPKGVLP